MYCDVSATYHGNRLDKFLAQQLGDFTRQRLQALIKGGQVMRAGKAITQPSGKVREGEQYAVTIPPLQEVEVLAEPIPLDIVYEDEHLLVINKTAGMVVHPAAGHASGTLVNALLHHCADSLSGIGGEMRPGIVHRLDKDTSGLMLVAKHDKAHQSLAAQLQDRSLSRIYHAWVWGVMQPPHGTIDAPIGRSPNNRKKMAVVESGKAAKTHYKTLAHYMTPSTPHTPSLPFASKLECKLESGRTHQIRVHCCEKGHALIGDPVYGAQGTRRLAALPSSLPEAAHAVLSEDKRQALHATSICFIHPHTQVPLRFDAEYPADMLCLEAALQSCYKPLT